MDWGAVPGSDVTPMHGGYFDAPASQFPTPDPMWGVQGGSPFPYGASPPQQEMTFNININIGPKKRQVRRAPSASPGSVAHPAAATPGSAGSRPSPGDDLQHQHQHWPEEAAGPPGPICITWQCCPPRCRNPRLCREQALPRR
eukprot:TRINITY_DN67067_c0_g1_i1.p1 TRINITY_DN67067_c0_g1~~TRINITY_DN67067_c0_g1_i1.p1  ORF type:complete len:152 (+),score=6.82 TRINITY_DN67067_c0_g1_i1:29-457(+)